MENVRELIKRNTLQIADKFVLEKTEKENDCDVCEYFARDGKIVLRGNNNVTIAHAYWCYLKKYLKAYFSHCSSFSVESDNSSAPLPDEHFKKTIVQKHRVYLDYITNSNSMWTWSWKEWEKELDYMAMNGVNMALNVVGNDAVLFNALVNSGLSQRSAGYFVSGPAFFAWQMTGKIDSYLPRNDYENYNKQLELAKKIYDRMISLDIEPVFSTFNGQISDKIIKLFGKVKNYKAEQWQKFPPTKKMDILDERFKKLMREYMFFQEENIGKARYFMCDYFCNFDHKTSKKKYMTDISAEYDKIINFCVSGKPCIVFPSEGYNKHFVSGIKNCDKLVFDLDGTMYSKTDFFDGNDCVIGNSHNNSPHTSLRGDVKGLSENKYIDLIKEHKNVVGVGFFPESLEQNPMYHELMFDVMTAEGSIELNEWIEDYIKRRYKSDMPNILKAYKILTETCYGKENGENDIGSVICTRPCAEIRHAAPYDSLKIQYDNKHLLEAVKLLLGSKTDNYNMKYCLIYTTIQLLDNFTHDIYDKIMKFYYSRDEMKMKSQMKTFLEIIEDIDVLLQSFDKTNAYSILKNLQEMSTDDENEKSITLNFLSSHTLWGPLILECQRFDYYWVFMSEFIIQYYETRWAKFFEYLLNNFGKRNIDKHSPILYNDRDAFSYNPFYKSMAEYEKSVIINFVPNKEVSGNTFEIVERLIAKYERMILDE